MSEMLANHYFLNRNFISAKSIYESILKKDSSNKSIKKKLTICYITTGEVNSALNLFLAQIKDDIDFILNTDTKSEDCPCPELIAQIEEQINLYKSEIDRTSALGILWLYCSLEKSTELFKKIEAAAPIDKRYREIVSILINKLMLNKPNSIN